MNTYAIVTQTLRGIREPESNRSALADTLLDGINEGYMRVVSEVIKPMAWADAVTLGDDRGFDVASLTASGDQPISRVDKVATYADLTENAAWREANPLDFDTVSPGHVVVPCAEAGSIVYVRVLLAAPVLTMAASTADATASTIPALIPSEYHVALAHYAAAHLWGTRAKYDKQSAAFDRFYNAIDTLRPKKSSNTGMIQNVYA